MLAGQVLESAGATVTASSCPAWVSAPSAPDTAPPPRLWVAQVPGRKLIEVRQEVADAEARARSFGRVGGSDPLPGGADTGRQGAVSWGPVRSPDAQGSRPAPRPLCAPLLQTRVELGGALLSSLGGCESPLPPPPLAGCQGSGGWGPPASGFWASRNPPVVPRLGSETSCLLQAPVSLWPGTEDAAILICRLLLQGAGRAGRAHPVPTACHRPSLRLSKWPAQPCHLSHLCVSVRAESECAHMCGCVGVCTHGASEHIPRWGGTAVASPCPGLENQCLAHSHKYLWRTKERPWMLVGQGVGWLVHVVRLGWDARGRGGFKGPLFPFRHTRSSQTQKPPRQEKPLEILTSSPPGPAVALPAARRPPGESQTLRGQVSVPKRETDTGLWGCPAHARAARDRWSNLKGDILESASAQHRLTRDRESLWASVFPSANGDRDSDPLPTLKFLEKTSWSYVGSACRGGGPLGDGCSHGR